MVSRKKLNYCRKTGKVRYHNELDAQIALAKLVWKDKGEKRIYKCQKCHGFHTTSQDKRSRRAA